MSVVGSDSVRMGASGIASYGYEIANSLRFDDGASQYLSRVSSSADADRTKAVVSMWLKRGALTGRHTIYAINSAGSVGASNQISMSFENAGANGDTLNYSNGSVNRTSTRVFRDPAAHLHFCQIFDTTQATQADRVKTYIGGLLIDDLNIAQDFSLSANTAFGQASVTEYIGRRNSGLYFDGLLDGDLIFTVGQDATIDDFGAFDATNPAIWRPKSVSGLTFGTNGFHLDFENGAGLGDDVSGNANNWTVNNTPVQSEDTPTDNHATLNTVERVNSTAPTISNGATTYSRGSTAPGWMSATQWLPDTGAYYWETDVIFSFAGAPLCIGVVNNARLYNQDDAGLDVWFVGPGSSSHYYARADSGTSVSATYITANPLTTQRLAHAYDGDTGKYWIGVISGGSITWGDPGAGVGDPAAGTNPLGTITERVRPFVGQFNTSGATRTVTATFYFGSTDWDATPPTGFVALSSRNFPDPEVAAPLDYVNVLLDTGTGATGRGLTGVGFQPDFFLRKCRSNAQSWFLVDAVRGAGNYMVPNTTAAEATDATAHVSFDADGVTIGNSGLDINQSSYTFVSLFLKELPGFFDIVGYTGDGVAGRNISHSLGVAPELLIGKPRTGTNNWVVGSEALTSWANRLVLNATSAQATDTAAFDSTAPDASNFRVSTTLNANPVTQIAYLFATMSGICMVGTYTGNGSADGPFVYCGGRPLAVIVRSIAANNWLFLDRERDVDNPATLELYPNLTNAEASLTAVDFTSTGFKVRSTAAITNTNAQKYLFVAFLDGSVGGELTPPATAQ